MDIEQIRKRLARPATKLVAGGFRPTYEMNESWLGSVFLYGPDEGIPTNAAGQQLLPFAQLYLPALPFVPPALDGVSLLTLFICAELPEALEPMGDKWLIREYRSEDVLTRKQLVHPSSYLKPFPLRAERVEEDYPQWDGGGIPADVEERIIELEEVGEIESYDDLTTHTYEHKLGGYPSFCQSGIDPGDDFEFVFQIASDSKIGLNVVDSGNLMFWKNRRDGSWALYYDFY